MRIGLIARADNSGLGTLSWEFANHLKPTKVLIIQNGVFPLFLERYKNYRVIPKTSTVTFDDEEWFLKDLDVVVSMETFYNWHIVQAARSKGVKTALVTMFEMSPESWFAKDAIKPDLYICPSKLDYKVMPEPKVYLPIPLNTEKLVWKKRTKAKRFIHAASHGGMNLRKGTGLLIEAMKLVRTNVKLTIFSWTGFRECGSNVEVQVKNFQNYWQIWREGDVLVYPQDYNGICLPVQEAFASGLGVISTDIFPFNEYLPKELLFKPQEMYRTRAATTLIPVDAAQISPASIAGKLDEWYNKDISMYSLRGREWGRENSWEKLLPSYLKTLEDLC